MGRRKLRFDQRKNYERKKYGLHIRIPLKKLKKPTKLVVSLPIAVYSSTPVPELSVLYSRLKHTITPGWSLAHTARSSLVLYKLQLLSSDLPSVTFSICIDEECRWRLMLGDKEINKEDCDMLSKYPCVLGCVDDVLLLLKGIDGSSLCVGNSDDRFSELVDARKGKFLDKYGKIIILNLNVFINNLFALCRQGYCCL